MHSAGAYEAAAGEAGGRETAPAAEALPGVHLALFGKHPAWRDFVALNPAEDGLLTATYEEVYCRCLDALQGGVWGPDPRAVVPQFRHALARVLPGGEVVLGVLVGSSDGLGRQQPLMLAACCRGSCYHRAVPGLLAPVVSLGGRLGTLADESAVAAALEAAAADFRERLRAMPPPVPGHAAALLGGLLSRAPFAGPGEELHRVVYQLVGHDAAVIGAPWERPRGFEERLPVQVRVPVPTTDPAPAVEEWLTFARFLCGTAHPETFFVSFGRPWGDLVLGAPGEAELAVLLKLPEGDLADSGGGPDLPAALADSPEPLTHCVPFSLDDPFRAAIERLREAARNPPPEPKEWVPEERSAVMEVTAVAVDMGGSVGAFLARLGRRLPRWPGPLAAAGEAVHGALWLAAGVALLVVAVLILWLAFRGAGAGDRGQGGLLPVPAAVAGTSPAGGPAGAGPRLRCGALPRGPGPV